MPSNLTQSLAFSRSAMHGDNNNNLPKLSVCSEQGIILSDLTPGGRCDHNIHFAVEKTKAHRV